MKKLTESKGYIVVFEYEIVYLGIKKINKKVIIGDFYGDPCTAVISEDEKFCVVGGEGIIIYYLQEPYCEYNRNALISTQWKEWGRDNNIVWVEKIHQKNHNLIEITIENGEKILLEV